MGRSATRTFSSSKSTGMRTAHGSNVRNATAYAATGARTFTKAGKVVRNPANYAKAVQGNSMRAAAAAAKRANPKGSFTYTAHLPGGKKYVGMTSDPEVRIDAHHTGKGASATRQHPPEAVTIHSQPSKMAAKAAETRLYYAEKAKHGGEKVRGAGYTKAFM